MGGEVTADLLPADLAALIARHQLPRYSPSSPQPCGSTAQ